MERELAKQVVVLFEQVLTLVDLDQHRGLGVCCSREARYVMSIERTSKSLTSVTRA